MKTGEVCDVLHAETICKGSAVAFSSVLFPFSLGGLELFLNPVSFK